MAKHDKTKEKRPETGEKIMKWIYSKTDLARILCAGLDVKKMKFDDKKQELTVTIEMPDPRKKLEELKEAASKIKNPEKMYQ